MEKMAVLGGTFDPVHNEHVQLVVRAIEELKLDKVKIIPTFLPPHKSTVPASATDRLNMLKLAFKDIDKVEICDYEVEKGGKSYTYLTIRHIRETFFGQLYFLVGGDMLTDFKNWRNPKDILSNCKLAVFSREGFYTDFNYETEYFKASFNDTFTKLNYVGKSCSSTFIRLAFALGIDDGGKVPKEVKEYILQNNVYGNSKFNKYFEFLKSNLTEKRLIHTVNVTVTALKKVKELGLDKDKVILASILHDCAKYIDYKSVKGFTLPDDVPAPVIHAFLGEFVARNILGVDDEEVLDAIKYHTSGKANMTTLAKLIFVADMVEDGRDYEGVEELRKYYLSDLNLCFKKCLEEEMLHLINKKSIIYFETINAYEYYVTDRRD